MKRILLLCATLILGANLAFAGDHPEAHFGDYGIKHHKTLSGYMKYIGKTVMYLPEYTPSYDDKNESPFASKGKFNVPFVITKITGSDTRMTFHMLEKGGKTKVKMVINNQNEYDSYGKYTFCIADSYVKYSVPLVVVDELEKKKSECIGQKMGGKYEVVDFKMDYPDKKGYPVPCYVIKNTETNKTFTVGEDANIQMLGHVYSHPKVKASYEVVELIKYKEYDWQSSSVDGYRLKNSITGETKDVAASSASTDCFKEDLSGKYFATLTQVERPSDSSDRYGATETIVDDGVTKFSYVDEYIDIVIFASYNQFNFVLKNVSPTSIKVIWNEAVFVDSDGSTSKVMHTGIKYSEREGDQPATTIIKGAKIDDLAAPTKNVRYSDVLKKWVTDSMFPSIPALKVDPIRLMLPIQVKDTINEYIFVFDVGYSYNHPELLNL